MVKKKKKLKINHKKLESHLSKFGNGLKQILVGASTHPATAALAVMGLTVITKELVTQGKEDTEWRKRFNGEMSGLYDGAQKLGVAAAVAPVVVGALSVTAEGIKALAKRPKPE